jgi:hypothetical protein
MLDKASAEVVRIIDTIIVSVAHVSATDKATDASAR